MFNFKNCNVLNMMYSDLAKFMSGFSIFSEGEGGSKGSYVCRGCWRGVKLSFAKSNLPYKFNKLGISEGCRGGGLTPQTYPLPYRSLHDIDISRIFWCPKFWRPAI